MTIHSPHIFSTSEVMERLGAARGHETLDHLAWAIAWLERRLRTNFTFKADDVGPLLRELDRARLEAVEVLPPRVGVDVIARGFQAMTAALKHTNRSYWLFASGEDRHAHRENRARVRILRNAIDSAWLEECLAASEADRKARVIDALSGWDEPFLPLPSLPHAYSIFD